MQKLSAKEINERMARIENTLEITPYTKLHMVQQTYPEIIVSSGKDFGKVRTYEETVHYLQSNAEKYGQKYVTYSKSQYYAQKDSLVQAMSDRITIKQAEERYRAGAAQLIKSYNEATGSNIDVWNIGFKTLKAVIDNATEDVGKRSKDRNDSPKLFKSMTNYFEENGIKND